MTNLNRVTLTGNLTHDPELRASDSGTKICQLRLAFNSRRKIDSEWVEKPNYADITVFGGQGENCNQYLAKGRPIAVDGRLDFQQWETDAGERRSKLCIIADTVQFLGALSNDGAPSSEPKEDIEF
jgi:single-strand DNA-binding protein